MNYCFPRKIRLLEEVQFKRVFSGAKKERFKISAEVFNIYFCHNDFVSPRLGVIVPKKNVKKASERNYFKRIIREQFRLNQNKFKKIDILVFVNKTRRDILPKEIKESLEKQFGKLIE